MTTNIDHFKCEVRRFDNIDSEIKRINQQLKPLTNRLKELRTTKKTLETQICDFMQTNEIDECKLTEGSLLFKESKNVIPLSKNAIHDNIVKFFNEKDNDNFKKLTAQEKGDELFKYVYENREYKENKGLKRV
tara:strand:+ start:998 stop:1396 length:399 start_codon:yes stop_codon:yes gene_type:complete